MGRSTRVAVPPAYAQVFVAHGLIPLAGAAGTALVVNCSWCGGTVDHGFNWHDMVPAITRRPDGTSLLIAHPLPTCHVCAIFVDSRDWTGLAEAVVDGGDEERRRFVEFVASMGACLTGFRLPGVVLGEDAGDVTARPAGVR